MHATADYPLNFILSTAEAVLAAQPRQSATSPALLLLPSVSPAVCLSALLAACHQLVHLAAVEDLYVPVAHELLVPGHCKHQCLLVCQLHIGLPCRAAVNLAGKRHAAVTPDKVMLVHSLHTLLK